MTRPLSFRQSNHPTGLLPKDIQTLETEFPDGGRIFSTHSPDDALLWLEAHYDDILLRTMRSYGLGGPIAAMLSPDDSALMIFGSILDHWVQEVAKLLSDISHLTVIIRPIEDDPLKRWSSVTEEPSCSVETEFSVHNPIEMDQDSNGSNEDMEDIQSLIDSEGSMDSWSTDSDRESLGSGFRPRGGADTQTKSNPWMSPEHSLDIHLTLGSDVECKVDILSKIQVH